MCECVLVGGWLFVRVGRREIGGWASLSKLNGQEASVDVCSATAALRTKPAGSIKNGGNGI